MRFDAEAVFFVVSESYFFEVFLVRDKAVPCLGREVAFSARLGRDDDVLEEVFRRAAFSGKRGICLNIIRECVMLDLKKGALRRIVAREKT